MTPLGQIVVSIFLGIIVLFILVFVLEMPLPPIKRFARWVWGLNGCVKRWGARGGPFTKAQLEELRMVSRHPSAADVEIGTHGRTHRGVGHLAHVSANALIQGASHDARALASRGISHTAPIPEGTFEVSGRMHDILVAGDIHVGDFVAGSLHGGDHDYNAGSQEQHIPTGQGPEEDTTLGEDSDGFLIKVADRLAGSPDLEKCDAFVSTLGASRGSGGFSVSSYPVVNDLGDTVWKLAAGGGHSSGVVVFAHEDVAIIVDVVACPGLQDRVEVLARMQHSADPRMQALEHSAVEWIRAALRPAAADRILGMLDLKNVIVRPVTKEPIRRALDLKGDDDEQQGGEK